ncbi:MAG: IS1595 family transposase, partial [Gammaproteobacteria bacterium]|nr:IS1595 family transposase [Gammaproteobacteria bacterium]
HCGGVDQIYPIKGGRPGLYKHGDAECRKQFSVTVGTLFERSHVPLNKWLMAVHLMCSSKKGISAHQLHRTLGVTYKTAWFMTHRIREAMRDNSGSILGGGGSTVEVDETFIGRDPNKKKGRGYAHKEKVLSLVERNGRARSFHVDAVNAKTLIPIIREQLDPDTHVMTDEASQYSSTNPWRTYSNLAPHFASHEFVTHGTREYVRGNVHTNSIEGFFSIFKRGMKGVYQHCNKRHLQRYLAEFDFRYNNRTALGVSDAERTRTALFGIGGKRLLYKGSN